MALNEALLPEFDLEMGNTRKTLERVPDEKLGWKPHERSMTMKRLAQHLAEIPGWGAITVDRETIDIAPVGETPLQSPPVNSKKDVLELFDKGVAAARAALAGATDEHLMKPWSLLAGGKTVFTMPRIAVLRSFVMNHII